MRSDVIGALFQKQVKDFIKNLQLLILFLIYPLVGVISSQAMSGPEVQADFFISIFATMHVIFSPIMVASSLVAEEKEKRTLRELTLANVTMTQFLISLGFFIFSGIMLTASAFIFVGGYQGMKLLGTLLLFAIGTILSTILGMGLGAIAKNPSSVSAYAMPAGIVLSFGPMFANFNKSIQNVTKFTFGQYICDWIQGTQKVSVFGILVVFSNFVAIVVFFCFAFHKNSYDVG